jgi:hypothetical protein
VECAGSPAWGPDGQATRPAERSLCGRGRVQPAARRQPCARDDRRAVRDQRGLSERLRVRGGDRARPADHDVRVRRSRGDLPGRLRHPRRARSDLLHSAARRPGPQRRSDPSRRAAVARVVRASRSAAGCASATVEVTHRLLAERPRSARDRLISVYETADGQIEPFLIDEDRRPKTRPPPAESSRRRSVSRRSSRGAGQLRSRRAVGVNQRDVGEPVGPVADQAFLLLWFAEREAARFPDRRAIGLHVVDRRCGVMACHAGGRDR